MQTFASSEGGEDRRSEPSALSEREPLLLELDDIVVQFGGVRILKQTSLHVKHGEIHALLGENGAGKSSLMKVLFGLYQKESGRILLRGEEVSIRMPQDALDHGIAMIHQELPFALHLSTAENIFLGREYRSRPFGFVDKRRQEEESAEMLEPFPMKLREISLDVRPGEVLGIGGLVGAGRTSLFDALFLRRSRACVTA